MSVCTGLQPTYLPRVSVMEDNAILAMTMTKALYRCSMLPVSMISGMEAGVAGVCGAEGEESGCSEGNAPPPGTGSLGRCRGSKPLLVVLFILVILLIVLDA